MIGNECWTAWKTYGPRAAAEYGLCRQRKRLVHRKVVDKRTVMGGGGKCYQYALRIGHLCGKKVSTEQRDYLVLEHHSV